MLRYILMLMSLPLMFSLLLAVPMSPFAAGAAGRSGSQDEFLDRIRDAKQDVSNRREEAVVHLTNFLISPQGTDVLALLSAVELEIDRLVEFLDRLFAEENVRRTLALAVPPREGRRDRDLVPNMVGNITDQYKRLRNAFIRYKRTEVKARRIEATFPEGIPERLSQSDRSNLTDDFKNWINDAYAASDALIGLDGLYGLWTRALEEHRRVDMSTSLDRIEGKIKEAQEEIDEAISRAANYFTRRGGV